jgi:serine/threonine protein kinase
MNLINLKELTNYSIIKKLGQGAFGSVYKVKNKDNNKYLALKVEEKNLQSRVKFEFSIFKNLEGEIGFPNVYNITENTKYNILVMDYLGPSLEDLFSFCNKFFSVKTVLMIGIQVINRIESLHNIGYIHRDIKPDNFLIGTNGKKSRIFMIDMGLAKKFIKKDKHIEFKSNRSFTGSFRYSSLRNHNGIEQSRRDDLESIGYMLIYFLKGKLPWQGLKGNTKSKRSDNISKVKNKISLDSLCQNLPQEFLLYIKYCRILRFMQKPDYDILRGLFVSLFKKSKYKLDYIYDWNIVAKEKKRKLLKYDS